MFNKERLFKWKFKHFKKVMKNGVRLKKYLDGSDRIVICNMERIHGGKYWATTDGGIVALPLSSKKFRFNEWVTA